MADAPESVEEKRVAGMYRQDCGIIILSVVVVWSALACVLHAAAPLTDDARVKLILVASAVAVGVFATAALTAVLAHLRRNRSALYREDLAHLKDRHE